MLGALHEVGNVLGQGSHLLVDCGPQDVDKRGKPGHRDLVDAVRVDEAAADVGRHLGRAGTAGQVLGDHLIIDCKNPANFVFRKDNIDEAQFFPAKMDTAFQACSDTALAVSMLEQDSL